MRTKADDTREGVRLAALLMDRVKPQWFRRIVFRRLEMQDGRNCIAGQCQMEWQKLEAEFERENPHLLAAPFAEEAARAGWIDEIRARRRLA